MFLFLFFLIFSTFCQKCLYLSSTNLLVARGNIQAEEASGIEWFFTSEKILEDFDRKCQGLCFLSTPEGYKFENGKTYSISLEENQVKIETPQEIYLSPEFPTARQCINCMLSKFNPCI